MGVSRKQSTPNIPKNEHFLPHLTFLTYVCYLGVRNVRFSENLSCYVFLKHPFWDSPFCLITNALADTFSWDWPSQGSNQDKIDHLTNEEQGHYGNIILWNILNTYLHTYLSLKTAPLMTLLPVKITQIWWLENWKYFDVPSLQLDELCPTVFMKKIIWHYCHWIVVILFTLSQFTNK